MRNIASLFYFYNSLCSQYKLKLQMFLSCLFLGFFTIQVCFTFDCIWIFCILSALFWMLQSSKSIYWCSGPTLTASLLLYKINLSCVCFPSLARRAQDDTFLCKGCPLHSPGQQPTVSQTPATVAHGAESSSPSRTQPTHPSPADAEGGSSSSSACHSNDL